MMKITLARRKTVLASAVLLLAGCATAPNNQGKASDNPIKEVFASEDPCSNNARNIGIFAGAILGAVIGNATGSGSDKSMVAGAALGGLLGGLIGADMDRKRCELSKVAKKYDLDITFANIEQPVNQQPLVAQESNQQPVTEKNGVAETKAESTVIGNIVTVRDKDGTASHFESGSDKLTPKAKEYFSAIAAQYAPDATLNGQTDIKTKEEISRQLAKRHILLVGHTDDTGSSQSNAQLAERRARTVAAFMKQNGVMESSIYYQGAGEAFPIADNRTEAGRAANRRVEIVEVADEAGFKKYLEMRKPNYAFYRTVEPTTTPSDVNPSVSSSVASPKPNVIAQKKTTKESKTSQLIVATGSTNKDNKTSSTLGKVKSVENKTKTAVAAKLPNINFGGVPYSTNAAKLNTGSLIPEKHAFSLISNAYADNSVLVTDCTQDRPRSVGAVKSLRNGDTYKTSEHMPQLYGKTWAGDINGNLVVINRLAVLRAGATPANLPELKVYAQYKPGDTRKADVVEEPQVNSYLFEKGILYRMFSRGDGGLRCVDVLFGTDGSTTARAGNLIYAAGSSNYVADFKPQMQ